MKINKNRFFWLLAACMVLVQSVAAMNSKNESIPETKHEQNFLNSDKDDLTNNQAMEKIIHTRLVQIWIPTATQICIGFLANILSPSSLRGKIIANGVGFSIAKLFKVMRHYYPLEDFITRWVDLTLKKTIYIQNSNGQNVISTDATKRMYDTIVYKGPCKIGRSFGFYTLSALAGATTRFTAEQAIKLGFLAAMYLRGTKHV